VDRNKSEKTPVVITDGRDGSTTRVASVRYGPILAVTVVCVSAGLSIFGNLTKVPPIETKTLTNLEIDDLLKTGDLKGARALLESEETARGLTPEMSNKLDSVYIKLAEVAASKNAKSEAIKLLEFIPSESSLYSNAQNLMKEITATPKTAEVAPKAVKKIAKKSNQAHKKTHQN
jgi:hypothetical protein